MKKLLALMLALGMTVSLAACGGGADTADTADNASETETAETADVAETEETADAAEASGDKYVVGICQLVQHEALDQATQGFKDALTEAFGENVEFDEQNASNDSATCATIINQFVSNNVDLILANATAPLQAALPDLPAVRPDPRAAPPVLPVRRAALPAAYRDSRAARARRPEGRRLPIMRRSFWATPTSGAARA